MTQRNTSGLVVGAILIGLGVFFLFAEFFNFMAWHLLWPFLVIGVGGLFFIGMVAGGKSTAGLAVPGSIISTVGLMLFFQNWTGQWATWAYGWTIILMAVGLGIVIMGAWAGDRQQRHSGWSLMKVGFVLFVIFGAFFEGLIFRSGNSVVSQFLFPVLLIVVGLYLLVRRFGPGPVQPVAPPSTTGNDNAAPPPQAPG
ncbi:MAG: hypothetical protein HY679_10880 [Chloroflexi bacterium]|nr:hypothetical protein [Chloroflexota bacterium]